MNKTQGGVFVMTAIWLSLFAIIAPATPTAAAAAAAVTSLRGQPKNEVTTDAAVAPQQHRALKNYSYATHGSSNMHYYNTASYHQQYYPQEPMHKPVLGRPVNNNKPNKGKGDGGSGEDFCVCPAVYDPVYCGPYQEEFSNLCTAKCEGSFTSNQCKSGSSKHQQPWLPLPPPKQQQKCECPYNYNPVVCMDGADEYEYPNFCAAECDGYYEKDCHRNQKPSSIIVPEPPKQLPKCKCSDVIVDPVLCVGGNNHKFEYAHYCAAECDGFGWEDCQRIGKGGAGKKPAPPGSDLDHYGCRPSAGERWCPTLGYCLRPFDDGPCPPPHNNRPYPNKPPYHPEPCSCPQVYDPVVCTPSSSYKGKHDDHNKDDDDYEYDYTGDDDYYDDGEYSNMCVAECEGGYYPHQCTSIKNKNDDHYDDDDGHHNDDHDDDGLEDVCFQSIEVGSCYAILPKWGYDANSNRCIPFDYGGCQGNDNQFKTKRQCENVCGVW